MKFFSFTTAPVLPSHPPSARSPPALPSKMSKKRASEPESRVKHQASVGSTTRLPCFSPEFVQWRRLELKSRAECKDDGAFAEDRRRAQHHGDDHQLDVADPPLSSGAQYYQADGGAGRVPRPEYRSKVPCVCFLKRNEKKRKKKHLRALKIQNAKESFCDALLRRMQG